MRTFLFALLVAIILVVSTVARADQDKVCDELAKLTCAPGLFDDGTGVSQIPSAGSQLQTLDKLKTSARDRFMNPLLRSNARVLLQGFSTGGTQRPEGASVPSLKALSAATQG